MKNLVYGDVKADVAEALGVAPSDARVLRAVNAAQRRMLNREDDPVGALVLYQFCTSEYCLVLPRQVRTVVGWEVCGIPGTSKPLWYRTHVNGPGQLCPTAGCGRDAIDAGITVSFAQPSGTNKYLRFYAQNASDAGKKVIVRYYRADTKAKQYSEYGGAVQEGEEITLLAPPNYALSTAAVMTGGLYYINKATTNYPIFLYEYDGISNTQLLGWYEPSETVPTYRKLFVPGLSNVGACASSCSSDSCGSSDTTCDTPTVTALVKLTHVPVVMDNDPLVIGNEDAFVLMAMAIQREKQERFEESAHLEAKAMRELRGELAAYLGPGTPLPMQVQDQAFGLASPQLTGWDSIYYAF